MQRYYVNREIALGSSFCDSEVKAREESVMCTAGREGHLFLEAKLPVTLLSMATLPSRT